MPLPPTPEFTQAEITDLKKVVDTLGNTRSKVSGTLDGDGVHALGLARKFVEGRWVTPTEIGLVRAKLPGLLSLVNADQLAEKRRMLEELDTAIQEYNKKGTGSLNEYDRGLLGRYKDHMLGDDPRPLTQDERTGLDTLFKKIGYWGYYFE